MHRSNRTGTVVSGSERLSIWPVDRLAVEAGVLAAEDGWAAHPLAAFLLFARYGAAGPGLAWLEGGPWAQTSSSLPKLAKALRKQ
ncbi:hypothetical protein [Kribbella sp. CA-293567]|uniref:hypothetical protein n=1 Tax=Kribbella sp. CA-293567 TaxID=3002436 RepID=UPI0022DD2C4F|nr:hypothetical protein [Kribbella sp. CA-293567]WBQ03407.1 hypothetical protein OX958_25955 [Kribbella sp. CA-293567]